MLDFDGGEKEGGEISNVFDGGEESEARRGEACVVVCGKLKIAATGLCFWREC